MASIRKRGPYQWEAQVRRQGYPAQSKTFNTKAEAEAWGKTIESEMVRGVWVSRGEAEVTSFLDALDRYELEVVPSKRNATKELSLTRVLKGVSFAKRPLATIRSADVAKLRDEWLKDYKPASAALTCSAAPYRRGARYFKKGRAVLCQRTRVKYRFINDHRHEFRVATMCRVLRVSRGGFYQWVHKPLSDKALEDRRLLGLIRDSYQASSGVYGYRRVLGDLREAGEFCSKHRVANIMRAHQIKAVRGYKAPRRIVGRPSIIAPNRLQRQFTVAQPDQAWVTDITYLRTWQGWLYLAVVIDLHSRKVVGWSMKPTLARELAIDALLMAVLRRQPKSPVIVHSDQGTQYGSDDWKRFCHAHRLQPSMSRRGNCWDNTVAESFFSSLKKERIRKRVYKTRDRARADVFDYIEVFYNRSRRHSHLGGISPEAFERAAA